MIGARLQSGNHHKGDQLQINSLFCLVFVDGLCCSMHGGIVIFGAAHPNSRAITSRGPGRTDFVRPQVFKKYNLISTSTRCTATFLRSSLFCCTCTTRVCHALRDEGLSDGKSSPASLREDMGASAGCELEGKRNDR